MKKKKARKVRRVRKVSEIEREAIIIRLNRIVEMIINKIVDLRLDDRIAFSFDVGISSKSPIRIRSCGDPTSDTFVDCLLKGGK